MIHADIKYSILPWDSALFGYTVARIYEPVTASELSQIVLQLKQAGVKLAYFISDSSDYLQSRIAENNGGDLVDTKVTYSKDINLTVTEYVPNSQIGSYTKQNVDPLLLSLSLQSGKYSRFCTDIHFQNSEYIKLYSEWIKRSVSRKIAFDVLVYRDQEGYIRGFITLQQDAYQGIIGLLSVDSDFQGKLIGSSLMQAAFNVFLKNGIHSVSVATQKRNSRACQFYEKHGFAILTQQNIHHFWL